MKDKTTTQPLHHHPAHNQRLLAWIICILASTFYVYEFFLRVTPSVIMTELMQTFHIDAKMFGILSSLFFYAYAPMQIPAGLLIDRYGPRLLITISVAFCALGVFLFSATTHIYIAAIGRSFIGFGSSFAFVSALVLVARWFPPRYFACIIGGIQFLGCIGAIAGTAPIAALTQHISWRTVMLGAACFGLMLTVIYWLVIRDAPKELHIPKIHDKKHSDEFRRLAIVLKNPQTWWVGICGFASWAPITVLASLWGVPFLTQHYHTNLITAATGISAIWVGVAVSSPIVGWWSNYIKRRNVPLIICYMIGLIASTVVIYGHHIHWPAMYILLFLIGVSAAAQVVTFGVVQDNNPATVEGTAVGFNNMAVIFGGIILQPLIGIILKSNWHGLIINGMPSYTLLNYRQALFVVPLSSLIGLIVTLFFLRETGCKVQYATQFLNDDDEDT